MDHDPKETRPVAFPGDGTGSIAGGWSVNFALQGPDLQITKTDNQVGGQAVPGAQATLEKKASGPANQPSVSGSFENSKP